MCWSAEVSLRTFLFACVSAIVAYNLGYENKGLILIVLSFSSMQLLEFFIWTYINNRKINELLSKIGLFIIGFQLFLLCLFSKNKYLLNLYFIFGLFFLLLEVKNINFKTDVGENGHLRWLWLDLPLFWLIIFTSFYLMTNRQTIHRFLFVLITLIISLYFYYRYKTWGSMWCYFSNLLWIFIIIISIYKYKWVVL